MLSASLSVCLSVCHSHESRLNSSRYRNTLCTMSAYRELVPKTDPPPYIFTIRLVRHCAAMSGIAGLFVDLQRVGHKCMAIPIQKSAGQGPTLFPCGYAYVHMYRMVPSIHISFPTGLNLRTLGSSNVFILLNGWICLDDVLD